VVWTFWRTDGPFNPAGSRTSECPVHSVVTIISDYTMANADNGSYRFYEKKMPLCEFRVKKAMLPTWSR
jgi:hypothetical protein